MSKAKGPTKPESMSDEQWEWKMLVQRVGEEEAKRTVVRWLRSMADSIEAPGFPEIFSATCERVHAMTILRVTTSYPWGG